MIDVTKRLAAALQTLPLVAILRGVKPDEVLRLGCVLHSAGFRLIEVPLNSPQALDSIARLRCALPRDTLVGAGTVLRVDEVDAVAATAAELIVAPNFDAAVVQTARARGLIAIPGVATPSEAFAALAAGAQLLKLFPAEMLPPAVVKAWRAVLPADVRLLPVGGITPKSMQDYVAAGAAGFGLGSALYRPGASAADVEERARAFASAWEALRAAR